MDRSDRFALAAAGVLLAGVSTLGVAQAQVVPATASQGALQTAVVRQLPDVTGYLEPLLGQARDWLDEAGRTYQKRVVTPLRQAAPEPSRPEPSRSAAAQGAKADHKGGTSGGIAEPLAAIWDDLSRRGAQAGRLASGWLEASNRNYQWAIVRHLQEPQPTTALAARLLAPGTAGLVSGGAEKQESVASARQVAQDLAQQPQARQARSPRDMAQEGDEQAPRAKPIELPTAGSRPMQPTPPDADSVNRAKEVITARDLAEAEHRAAAALELAQKRIEAERQVEREVVAARDARLADARKAEEAASERRRLAAQAEQARLERAAAAKVSEERAAVGKAIADAKARVERERAARLAKRAREQKRRSEFIVASHGQAMAGIQKRQQAAVAQKRVPGPPDRPQAGLTLSDRNLAGTTGGLSDAAKRRLAETPRSGLGVRPTAVRPPPQPPKAAEGDSSGKRQVRSAQCGGKAGRRAGGRYVVAAGDSLWRIAERYSQNPESYVRAIYRANRGRISKMDVIRPCQTLRLP